MAKKLYILSFLAGKEHHYVLNEIWIRIYVDASIHSDLDPKFYTCSISLVLITFILNFNIFLL